MDKAGEVKQGDLTVKELMPYIAPDKVHVIEQALAMRTIAMLQQENQTLRLELTEKQLATVETSPPEANTGQSEG